MLLDLLLWINQTMKTMAPHPSCAEFVYSAIQGFENFLHFHLALSLQTNHFPFSQCSKHQGGQKQLPPVNRSGMSSGKLTLSLELPHDTSGRAGLEALEFQPMVFSPQSQCLQPSWGRGREGQNKAFRNSGLFFSSFKRKLGG